MTFHQRREFGTHGPWELHFEGSIELLKMRLFEIEGTWMKEPANAEVRWRFDASLGGHLFWAPSTGRVWFQGSDAARRELERVVNQLAAVRKFDIGAAVQELKAGRRVARAGWNGTGMWLAYVAGARMTCQLGQRTEEKGLVEGQSSGEFVVMRTATGAFVPWTCSQADLLATDYEVVP